MAMFHSYVKLPEGKHRVARWIDHTSPEPYHSVMPIGHKSIEQIWKVAVDLLSRHFSLDRHVFPSMCWTYWLSWWNLKPSSLKFLDVPCMFDSLQSPRVSLQAGRAMNQACRAGAMMLAIGCTTHFKWGCHVGRARISHTFGNGSYNLLMVNLWWFGWWFICVLLPVFKISIHEVHQTGFKWATYTSIETEIKRWRDK